MKETIGFVKGLHKDFTHRMYRYVGSKLRERGTNQQLKFRLGNGNRVIFEAPKVNRDGSIRKRSPRSYFIVVADTLNKEAYRTKMMTSSTSTTVRVP